MNINNNGFKIAFWVMATIATVGLIAITNAVVANDRLSRERDDKIINTISIQYQDVIQRLTRIETKIIK